MLKWKLEEIDLDLKFNWKIAREESKHKKNYIISLSDEDGLTGVGEIALSSRFVEKVEDIKNDMELFLKSSPGNIEGIEDLRKILLELHIANPLSFGIESAFVHYLSIISDTSIPDILGVDGRNALETSFSIPILESEKDIHHFVKNHNLSRFSSLKLKIDQEHSEAYVNTLLTCFGGKIRIDANEAFDSCEQVVAFIDKLDDIERIEFLEQPLPASMHEDYLELYKKSKLPIFADESIVDGEITDYIVDRFHGVNIKLMKSGSYFKALKQMKSAKEKGLKVLIGCMIETSVGISSAMNIASLADYLDLDGFLLLKNDPYKVLGEEGGKLYFSHYH